MATKTKTYFRRRKGKREEHDEEIPHFQGRWPQGRSLKREKMKEFNSDDESAKRLELDVAEALAEFWRMAHEPSQLDKFDAHLRWSHKRRRSSLLKKDSFAPGKPKEEPDDALSSAKKNRSSCTFGRDSSLSDRDEIESTRTSKESSQFESRAQSPSSPLPSLQLPRGNFLACGSAAAKSAFQRVLPLVPRQRPCLLPVKSEIEDIQLEGFAVRPQNVPVRRKLKSSKSTTSKAIGKMEPVGEQTIDTRDWEGAASPEELRVKSDVCPVSGLTVSNKPKSALSEREKEARRLRRIQANRESARQTIRKKQVVCEELMRKASSLALENEGMKQKRESLMLELFSLKGQNYHLKQQLEMGASGNPAELPQKTSSESVSVPALQVPSLPYGVPAHSLAWAVAAAQAAAANQAYTFLNKDKTLGASHTNMVLQHQAAAFPSSKEASGLRVIEERTSSHAFNGVCSPASMGMSPKETGSSTIACTESFTPQSEAALFDPSTTAVADPVLTDDLPEESACVQANCSLSQPPSLIMCSSKAGSDTMPATAVAYESMECFMSPQIKQGVRCGYTYDGSRSGHFFNGHSQTNAFMGRNYFAAIAAADARRKRKELTRHKFPRSRALRLAILADNTKEL